MKINYFIMLSVGVIMLMFACVSYVQQPQYQFTHQYDSYNKKWVIITWKVLSQQTPDHYQGEWAHIELDYSTNPHKYVNDCCPWGLVNSLREFNALFDVIPHNQSTPCVVETRVLVPSRIHPQPECLDLDDAN